jgi:LPXTG-site transpeptidase (sortase) family protein
MVKYSSHLPRRARAAMLASRLLLAAGIILILLAGGSQLYAMYAQMRWERAQAALTTQFLPVPTMPSSQPLQPTMVPTVAATATPVAGTPVQSVAVATATVEKSPGTATPAPSATPTPTPDDRSDPGRLVIPKLKVNTQIVVVPLVNRQWDVSHILYEAGLLDGTGWPGRPGNAALSGHVSLKGRGDGPFRWLEKLAAGDDIIIDQGTMRYTYHVNNVKVVLPTDVSVLAPTENATLTLITCTDWDFLNAEYSKRMIVTATLVDQGRTGPL